MVAITARSAKKFPYSFLYYLDAIMDEMRKRGRHLVQYFCQWSLSDVLTIWHIVEEGGGPRGATFNGVMFC